MPIEFPCHTCEQVIRVNDEFAGKRAKCPGCGTALDIPGQPNPFHSDPTAGPGAGLGSAPKSRDTISQQLHGVGEVNPFQTSSSANGAYVGTLEIKRVDIWRLGAIGGGIQIILGLLIGLVYLVLTLMAGATGARAGVGIQAMMQLGFLGGIIFMVIFPILWGAAGFVSGVFLGMLYNLAASWIGGIRFDY